jgi:hypothetical protein
MLLTLLAGTCLLAPGYLAIGGNDATTQLHLTDQEKEEFLLKAKIISTKGINVGVTGTTRMTMSDGKLTHDAHLQCIDVSKTRYQTPSGTELNFRDCYKFNIAAYKLDRMINLNMVPVSVERRCEGKVGSVTWWIDDVLMMERKRYTQKIKPPNQAAWNDQIYQVRVFNELVYNVDPNLTNLMITNDWKVRMIDFSRAFRLHKKLRNEKNLVKIDRRVYDGLKGLDPVVVRRELSPLLKKGEINALMARRDKIVEFFDKQIAKKGEAAVICNLSAH